MKTELKDKILLQTPDIGAMQPHKLDGGKLRKAELVRLQNRSIIDKSGDAVSRGWRFVHPSVGRIVEGIIIAVVSSIISGTFGFWLGRATAADIPDEATEKAADKYKQEHSDNVTIRLD